VVGRHRRVQKTLSLHSATSISTVTNVEFYAQVMRILSSAGYRRPAWQPAKTWIQSIELSNEAENILNELTDRYYQIRFGEQQLNRNQRLAMSRRSSEFSRVMQKGLV